MNKSPILNVIMASVQRASRDLVRDFGEVENLQVSRKGVGDFVSQADKRSEETLVELLKKARPDFHFLAEESGTAHSPRSGSDMTWIIDPLDGTMNFLHGLPHFCITVALKKGDEVIAAVTYDPIRDEMFMAEKGQGVYVNRRRLRVSVRTQIDEAMIGVGHMAKPTEEGWYQPEMSIRCTGSAALDLAYVAAGRFDAVRFQRLKPWDVAAGLLFVQEAGGMATDLHTKRAATWESTDFVAGSTHFHQLLLREKAA